MRQILKKEKPPLEYGVSRFHLFLRLKAAYDTINVRLQGLYYLPMEVKACLSKAKMKTCSESLKEAY
jgi:hypothetical protein